MKIIDAYNTIQTIIDKDRPIKILCDGKEFRINDKYFDSISISEANHPLQSARDLEKILRDFAPMQELSFKDNYKDNYAIDQLIYKTKCQGIAATIYLRKL